MLSAVNWDSEGYNIGHPEYTGPAFKATTKHFYLMLFVGGTALLLKNALTKTKLYQIAAKNRPCIFLALRTMVCEFSSQIKLAIILRENDIYQHN